MDEVNFIQNLVYYVERAYRIPDFGIWEIGSRENVGRRELHARSETEREGKELNFSESSVCDV